MYIVYLQKKKFRLNKHHSCLIQSKQFTCENRAQRLWKGVWNCVNESEKLTQYSHPTLLVLAVEKYIYMYTYSFHPTDDDAHLTPYIPLILPNGIALQRSSDLRLFSHSRERGIFYKPTQLRVTLSCGARATCWSSLGSC